ncbi:MAG: hypothetical protein AB1757_01030 [Acidobacteriota bacterium]
MAQQGAQRGNPMQDYVTVAERIEKFYREHPQGRIITHILEHDAERGFILMRAEVFRNADDAQPAATGHAYEYRDAGFVQKTSYIEVCETSSVGRALALCGFEVKRGIASREEMEKQTRMAETFREKVVTAVKEASPVKPERVATETATTAPAKTERMATEIQKDEILELLESIKPNQRPAQKQLLVEFTGKQSREELSYQEAARLIEKLKELNQPAVEDDPLI